MMRIKRDDKCNLERSRVSKLDQNRMKGVDKKQKNEKKVGTAGG